LSSLEAAIDDGRESDAAPRLDAPRRSGDLACSRPDRPGVPKAAMHSHRDFAFNTEVYAKHTVGYREDDIA